MAALGDHVVTAQSELAPEDESKMDHNRQYVVQYITNSAAGPIGAPETDSTDEKQRRWRPSAEFADRLRLEPVAAGSSNDDRRQARAEQGGRTAAQQACHTTHVTLERTSYLTVPASARIQCCCSGLRASAEVSHLQRMPFGSEPHAVNIRDTLVATASSLVQRRQDST